MELIPIASQFYEQIKYEKIKYLMKSLGTVVLLGFVLFTASASAQENGAIFGKIVDSETGEELIGANILLEGTTIGAASDIEGNYKISSVPPGSYYLIASMIGYSKLTVTNLEVKPGEQKKLDLSLVSEAYETEEVVVTAINILSKSIRTNILNNPKAIQEIEEDLDRWKAKFYPGGQSATFGLKFELPKALFPLIIKAYTRLNPTQLAYHAVTSKLFLEEFCKIVEI